MAIVHVESGLLIALAMYYPEFEGIVMLRALLGWGGTLAQWLPSCHCEHAGPGARFRAESWRTYTAVGFTVVTVREKSKLGKNNDLMRGRGSRGNFNSL